MAWLRTHKDELMVVVCVAALAAILMHGLGDVAWRTAIPASIVAALLLVLGFFKALEKRRRPLRTERHPQLGEVTVFRDRWEASVPLMGRSVRIMGGSAAASPSHEELRLLKAITAQLSTIVAAGVEALGEDLRAAKPPLTADQVALSSISLEPDNRSAQFSLYFDTLAGSKALELGLYADYSEFAVVEAGWVH